MKNLSISPEEISQFRLDTQGVQNKIHFNNAGTSLPPEIVVKTMIHYLEEESIRGGYETEAKYLEELENLYPLVAKFINADREEIALVENASMAWGIAFQGIHWEKGDEIIVSEMEYSTNVLGFLNAKKRFGIKIIKIDQDPEGDFPLQDLEKAIGPKTKLIAMTHIGSGSGSVLPVNEIGEIAQKHHVLYLLDACQTLGQIPINVKEIGCDFLSVTGRKYMRAPRGTGFLYIRKGIQDYLNVYFMDGHSVVGIEEDEYKPREDARKFELYEKNRAIQLGFGKALEYASRIGMDRIWERIQMLSTLFRLELSKLDKVEVQDSGGVKCGIVTFTVQGMDSQDIKTKLAENQINVSVGNTKSTLYYMNKKHLKNVVRASIHYYNTEEEIQTFCRVLESIMEDPFGHA